MQGNSQPRVIGVIQITVLEGNQPGTNRLQIGIQDVGPMTAITACRAVIAQIESGMLKAEQQKVHLPPPGLSAADLRH